MVFDHKAYFPLALGNKSKSKSKSKSEVQMSEMNEVWKAYKQANRAYKKKKIADALDMLDEKNIQWESSNDGVHVIVAHKGRTADFWPSSDKFRIRGIDETMLGIDNLFKQIGAI